MYYIFNGWSNESVNSFFLTQYNFNYYYSGSNMKMRKIKLFYILI